MSSRFEKNWRFRKLKSILSKKKIGKKKCRNCVQNREDLNFSKETVLEHIDQSDDKITSVKLRISVLMVLKKFSPNVKFTHSFKTQKKNLKSRQKQKFLNNN